MTHTYSENTHSLEEGLQFTRGLVKHKWESLASEKVWFQLQSDTGEIQVYMVRYGVGVNLGAVTITDNKTVVTLLKNFDIVESVKNKVANALLDKETRVSDVDSTIREIFPVSGQLHTENGVQIYSWELCVFRIDFEMVGDSKITVYSVQ
ncbi:hypothetical protein [Bacillus mycoides]|uniref:hypothetical protein n=1 Tax=Bacillus mycoides TaxID=1405 RepID=UPI003A7FC28B